MKTKPERRYPKAGFAVDVYGQADVLVSLDGNNYTSLKRDEARMLLQQLTKALDELTNHLNKHTK
jgi:hypothetical protein